MNYLGYVCMGPSENRVHKQLFWHLNSKVDQQIFNKNENKGIKRGKCTVQH